ncbi:hypothetical protein [Rufibacter soli]
MMDLREEICNETENTHALSLSKKQVFGKPHDTSLTESIGIPINEGRSGLREAKVGSRTEFTVGSMIILFGDTSHNSEDRSLSLEIAPVSFRGSQLRLEKFQETDGVDIFSVSVPYRLIMGIKEIGFSPDGNDVSWIDIHQTTDMLGNPILRGQLVLRTWDHNFRELNRHVRIIRYLAGMDMEQKGLNPPEATFGGPQFTLTFY